MRTSPRTFPQAPKLLAYIETHPEEECKRADLMRLLGRNKAYFENTLANLRDNGHDIVCVGRGENACYMLYVKQE